MAIAVIMPKQGQSVETCIISKWFKKTGDSVSAGDILLSYETDKAAFDLESTEEGTLLDTFFNEGDEVPVLVNVAVIGKSGEETDSFNPDKTRVSKKDNQEPIQKDEKLPEKEKSLDDQSSLIIKPISTDSKIRISPRARRMAGEKGIDLTSLQGSGPNGRIVASDIEKVVSDTGKGNIVISSSGNDYLEKPMSNVRKIIAKTMFSSLQNSAQLTHHMSADVSHLLEARQKVKSNLKTDKNQQDVTLNDMICYCVIRALEKFPEANSQLLNDNIRTFSKVHLGIAVDTPRGLMVPTVKNASDMHLAALSKALKSVAEACKQGSISPELIQSTSATFTVSNLGNYGVEMFTPVINLPQVGILGVCTIISRPTNMGNNIFGFVPHIGLSLTYDHRAIDGGPATLFLKEIKEQIEAFRY